MDVLRANARSDSLVLRSKLAEISRRIGSWDESRPDDSEVSSVDAELEALAVEVRRFTGVGLGGL
jgi:hypothetical protein